MIHKIDGNNYPTYTKQKSMDIPDTGEKFNLESGRNPSPSDAKTQREKEAADKGKQQAAERSGVRLELSSNGRMADAGRQKQQETAKAQASSGPPPLLESIRSFIRSIVAAVQDFFSKIWNDQPSPEAEGDITEEIRAEEIADAGDVIDAAENADVSEMSGAAENADVLGMAGAAENTNVLEMSGAAENADVLGMAGAADNTDVLEMIDTSDIMDIPESFGFGKNAGATKSMAAAEIIDTSEEEIPDPAVEEERRNRKIRQFLQDGDMEQVISLLTENGKRTIAKNSTLLTSYDKHGRVVEPSASDRERALHGDRNSWKL